MSHEQVDASLTSHSSLSNNNVSLNQSSLFIECTKKTKQGKRVYDKRHACYFCFKQVGKVARHLTLVHKEEHEVAKLMALCESSKERREGFLCLLRAGDYYHNCNVLTTKQGELILSRRPTVLLQKIGDYVPCPNCLGFFHSDSLWRHVKKNCPLSNKTLSRRDIRGESYALLCSWSEVGFSLEFKEHILSNFKQDEISQVCHTDEIIMKFGALLFEKFSSNQYEYIRQSMRQPADLDNNIKNLTHALLPKHFDTSILAVKKLCATVYDKQQKYTVPSLALKLGHSLRKCSQIVRGVALRKGDLKLEKEMSGFISIMEIEWQNRISSVALRSLSERKMNSAQMLPITEDLMKLNFYLDDIITMHQNNIQDNVDIRYNWSCLDSAVLSRLVLFNKRRSGEVARLTLTQYACRPQWEDQNTTELKESLTAFERELASRLIVVEVKGKSRKNPKVPILITQPLKKAIDVLIEYRNSAEINDKNAYVFARGSNSLNNLRGHDCLKQAIAAVSLKRPESITSTKLRKYIATVVQVFDLKENEADWLARHLGHDIQIHRDFYRLHESAVELTKVSRILLAVDSGQSTKFCGKPLNEIVLEDIQFEGDGTNGSESEMQSKGDIPSFPDEGQANVPEEGTTDIVDPCTITDGRHKVKRKPVKPQPWSTSEKQAVLKHFAKDIRRGTVPGKEDCLKCISMNKELETREWKKIKYFIKNHIAKTRNLDKK
nr:unnamed protein product [Callosobruchus analis]